MLRTWIALFALLTLVSICSGGCSACRDSLSACRNSLSSCKSSASRYQKEQANTISHLQEQRVDIALGWAMKMTLTKTKTGEVYGWMEGFYRPTTNIPRGTTITIVPSTEIPPGVRIYHDHEFTGLFTVLGIGAYAKNELPFPARTISSIKIPDGHSVTIFRNPSFMGDCATLIQSTGNLGHFNDKIESLEIEEIVRSNHSHKAIAFKQSGFQGKMMLLSIGVNNVCRNCASFKIEEGYVATLHTVEEWYVRLSSGHHKHILPWTIQPITITISTSSNTSLPYASLYEHDCFDGRRADVLDTRMNRVPKGISSLSVKSGYAIRLYSEEEFKGRNVIVTGIVNSLSMYTLNDEVRSLEVMTDEHVNEQPLVCNDGTCYTLPVGKTLSYDNILWYPYTLNVPEGYIVSVERFGNMIQYVHGSDQYELSWSRLFHVKAYIVAKI